MAKTIGLCGVCKARKLLNYARLCKRCAKNPRGLEVMDAAAHEHAEAMEEAAHEEEVAAEAAEAAAEAAPEVTGDAPADAEDKKK